MKVIQVLNVVTNQKRFKNPQRGRVYDPNGLAPCIYCYGGGNLEAKIIIYEDRRSEDDHDAEERQGQD